MQKLLTHYFEMYSTGIQYSAILSCQCGKCRYLAIPISFNFEEDRRQLRKCPILITEAEDNDEGAAEVVEEVDSVGCAVEFAHHYQPICQ